jgi:sirohydrochlorin ferrochelatase
MPIRPGESRLSFISVSDPSTAAEPLPQRASALPRRTTRTLRAGRHRSPHRLTVPSDAPALVLAVPGAYCAASDELTGDLAAAAGLSCPGVDVRVGYLAGEVQRLQDALTFPAGNAVPSAPLAVIVPLLAGPHPEFDAALARAADQTSAPVMLAAHLGPHPLLAEALHARLAEAGLAPQGRAIGRSIVTSTNGILVLADRGEEAVQAAGVIAVLLAARLSVPAAPASLGYPGSVDSALMRLREAGVSSPAIAPCVIGPETPPHSIEIIRTELGAPCAPPLGSHLAVAQLIAIRYGAALASLTMVGLRSPVLPGRRRQRSGPGGRATLRQRAVLPGQGAQPLPELTRGVWRAPKRTT